MKLKIKCPWTFEGPMKPQPGPGQAFSFGDRLVPGAPPNISDVFAPAATARVWVAWVGPVLPNGRSAPSVQVEVFTLCITGGPAVTGSST